MLLALLGGLQVFVEAWCPSLMFGVQRTTIHAVYIDFLM